MDYVLGIDQSTQGTKAILVDRMGQIAGRADIAHRQIISRDGWVSHDLEEIYRNTLEAAKRVVAQTGIERNEIRAVGISNQRETTAAWDENGKPYGYAVVWQCARAKEIAEELRSFGQMIRHKTGLPLSPYFPAAKMAWILRNASGLHGVDPGRIRLGTVDTWLVWKLTNGDSFKTDYSNASRTQLFNIHTLKWDEELCRVFGIPMECLPEVTGSDACFGWTDLGGFLEHRIPIHAAMGDSHAALYGQGCCEPGMLKTTYGTGSSIMMNIGNQYRESSHGLATSIAWGIHGKVTYVLEGNINYTGAVISWLKDDVKLVQSPAETSSAAECANPLDQTVLVPAFSGLSAPYWNDDARAMICNMSRMTGRNEIIRAALESIALQINAVLEAMKQDSGYVIREVRADGGPTHNPYLMQFQSDISDIKLSVSAVEELSALGAAYLAGIADNIYDGANLFAGIKRTVYLPMMSAEDRQAKIARWNQAVSLLSHAGAAKKDR